MHVFVLCVVQVCEVSAEGQVRYELETRFQQLQSRLSSVTLETEEVKSCVMLLIDHITVALRISVIQLYRFLSDLRMTQSHLWTSFRSVRHLRQRTLTCWKASAMMTATPPLTPPPPNQQRAQVTAQELNPPWQNAEPIYRTPRVSTLQWALSLHIYTHSKVLL